MFFFADLTELSTNSDMLQYVSTKKQKCTETSIIQPGCEIVDKKCQCWPNAITVCKGIFKKWDFENLEVSSLLISTRENFI